LPLNRCKIDEGYELSLISDKFAKDVCLSFENEKGFFNDDYFDLFPGTIKKIEYITTKRIDNIRDHIKVISLIDSYKN